MMEKILIRCPHFIKFILVNLYGFFLARRRFSGNYKDYYNQYIRNLDKSPNEIANEQRVLMKSNLIHAFTNIPYYNKIFKEVGFNPYEFNSFDELNKIPVLTKEIIRQNFNDLYDKRISSRKFKAHYTSGSTGEKLKFLLPKELFFKKQTALLYRFYSFWGVNLKDRRVTLGGRNFTNKHPFWIKNIFENQLIMSSHHLNSQTAKLYLKKIHRFDPIFIQGHPSVILLLSKYLKEDKYNLMSLKVIFTTGENLTREDQILIEKSFDCPVAQQYGSGESCFSSQQIPKEKGFFINYEHGFIELLGKEAEKEVIVTSFQNEVMPFIRYKMNDFVLPTEPNSSVNLNLPIMFNEVIGRLDDVIKLKNGNRILPVSIRMRVKPFLSIGTNYQLIQYNHNNFSLNLVDSDRILNHKKILSNLFHLLGEDVSIELNYVDKIMSKGGKQRSVISEIK